MYNYNVRDFFLYYRSIKPGEIANSDFELLPHLDGDKTLSAKFYSSELNDVDGFVTVTVNPSNEIPLN